MVLKNRFSICLPVRNGWPYVEACVNSILQQTYPHFDLHIFENSSTDETGSWLKSLTDERIHVYPATADLNIVENWARIKTIKKQEFMTLIGHDDLLDQDFLATINQLINKYPEAGLYVTSGRMIDAAGRVIRSCSPVPEIEQARDYLQARLSYQRDVFGTGYVMRSADYDRIGGIPPFERLFFADDALWLLLMVNSSKVSIATEHFSVRLHAESESASLPSSWLSLVHGLNQFGSFLQNYAKGNDQARLVIDALVPSFMLRSHQKAYILALVEACQGGYRIKPNVVNQIKDSLAVCAPSLRGKLRCSGAIAIIELLNVMPVRGVIPKLWKIYLRRKNQA